MPANSLVNAPHGEMIVGILLDLLPPFDRQTVPPTDTPLMIGCVSVAIPDDADCGDYNVWFCDGATACGSVAIDNIAIINTTEQAKEFATHPCLITVVKLKEFKRGDCNDDERCDIADSASILAWQFQGFVVNCEDACDINDDGKINLADAVYNLNFLFKDGAEPVVLDENGVQRDPWNDPAADLTVDDPTGLHAELGCETGDDPCE